MGRCPFHDERTPSFSVNAVEQALLLLRLRRRRRPDQVRPRDRAAGLRRRRRVARRALPGGARVRGDVAPARGVAKAPRAAPRGPRPGRGVLRAPPLGDGGGRAGARVPRVARARRGGLPRVPARALTRDGPRAESTAEGLHAGRAPRCRPHELPRERLLPAPADVPTGRRTRPDRRLPGAQAARG